VHCNFLVHKCLELTGKNKEEKRRKGGKKNIEKREEEDRKRSISIKG
jgi:hypothetical protein